MSKLLREKYIGDTVSIARDLLGKFLVRMWNGQPLVCRIVETEAYVGAIDKAAHAYGYHKTPRNAVMFGPAGHAYIYLIYGMHCCLNFVTEPEGEPAAILIRGGEARGNLDSLAENRFHCKASELTAYQKKNLLNGPGKLCAALNIDRGLNGLPWGSPELFLCDSLSDAGLPPCPGDELPPDVKCGKRVGIDYAGEAADFPWRFYV